MGDNRLMSRLACAVVVAFALAASACASAQAKGDAGGPALAPPVPPPHTIIPVEIVEEPAAPPEPTSPAPAGAQPPTRRRVAKPDKPAEKPDAAEKPDPAAVPIPPAAQVPAPPLQTMANPTEVEKTIRTRMAQASRDLERTDYRALNPERRVQYDTAKRFIQQAEDALKAKNFVFAEQLADKAATLAAAVAQK
jgi:hypothetical protein